MALLPTTPLFAVGDHTFDWADLKIAAVFWGDWQGVEGRAREGFACLRFLEESGRQLDEAMVEAAAEAFREERNLLAAEEMNAWLEARGLDVDGWMGFVERSVARDLCAEETESVVAETLVEDAAVFDVAECEAICAGILSRTFWQLAATAVLAVERQGEDPSASPVAAPDEPSFERATRGLDEASRSERVRRIGGLRSAFEKLRSSVVTEESVARAVSSHALEWTTLHCRLASFANEDQALEAALCVREEARDLAEVAESAGLVEERAGLVLEDLPPELQTQLLSAEKGVLTGPMLLAGRQTLVIVTDKLEPSPDDPSIRERAERTLLETAVARRARSGARILLEI